MLIKLQDTKRTVTKPSDIHQLLHTYFKTVDAVDRDKEHFFCFQLDSRNKVKVMELISIGIVNASLVHPREVFTRAVMCRNVNVVIAHNHPSTDVDPSDADLEITRKLVAAEKILGIELTDHIIYAPDAFYSFREHGLI